ncbi:DUF5638 domain-containing protein [Legionella maioricensis]|uniref:DUF5638 domain-containing protein n=1 Tax=Legionella maioricensis TaxID=2896528 RepID=A0A9X2D1C6_9GAMM|nr:DUF5638 domain-containing protein [Legionella maioricensis]MCL9684671.1 DUF5638 domain-containing protein [Legionella maioricensis]MCL9687699.1 DUF5638 domain-containing protein [Legionella maioricensis]
MPSYNNAELLAQRIADCNVQLDSLFADLDINSTLKMQLGQIKYFYQRAFDKTSNEKNALRIALQYEQFIITATEVKLGQLTADGANDIIADTTDDRQFNIVMYNILKVCELFFWTAVAAAAYVGCITTGIPLLFLEPFTGFAVTAGTSLLFAAAVHQAGECFEEFKTFARINAEDTRERSVISFFSSQPLRRVEQTAPDEDLESSSEPTIYTACN